MTTHEQIEAVEGLIDAAEEQYDLDHPWYEVIKEGVRLLDHLKSQLPQPRIKTLLEIDNSTKEGELLLVALVLLTETEKCETPHEVLIMLNGLLNR